MKPLTYEYAKNHLKHGDNLVVIEPESIFPKFGRTVTFLGCFKTTECIKIQDENGYVTFRNPNQFSLMEDTTNSPQTLSVKDEILLAKSYIGKTVTFYQNKFVAKLWRMVLMDDGSNKVSMIVNAEANKNGYCVAVGNEEFLYPVKDVSLVTNEVVLSKDYTAIVTKDSVKVGCQTFPSSIINDLKAALDACQ